MKLSRHLSIYIIFAVIFGVLVYLKIITVSWTFSWTIGIEFVGGIVIRFIDFVDEQRTDKKTELLVHSKELVKDLQNGVNSEVVLNQEENSFKLEVKSYSKEINEHLEDDAYRDICKIIRRRDFYINNLYNYELQELFRDLSEDIISNIKQRIPVEWDSSQPEPPYFVRKNILSSLAKAIREKSLMLDCLGNILYQPGGGNWVKSDNENERKEIGKMAIMKFNSAISSKRFGILMLYLDNIREDPNQIKEKLNKIINDVGKDIPLKGSCKKCPKKDGFFWRHAWQIIKK